MAEEIAEGTQPTMSPTSQTQSQLFKYFLFALAGFLLLTAGAVGGYWYGTQQAQRPTPTSVSIPTPIPTPTPQARDKVVDCRMLEKLEMKDLAQVSGDVCRECRGKWELLSMDINTTGCNPKTSDVGKTCTNYDQCVGSCLAENESSTSGFCSEYKYRLGCSLELSESRPVMTCRD